MIMAGKNRSTRRKNCSYAIFKQKIPPLTDLESNQCLRGEKPSTRGTSAVI